MRAAILAVAATVIVCVIGLTADERPKPKTHAVTMENMRFQPESLTVARGDTVVWVNKDLVPHTATSKAGGFDSQAIQAEKSWRFTVRKKGDFAYVCTFHPTMTATLRVR
jgi:plastocyanin